MGLIKHKMDVKVQPPFIYKSSCSKKIYAKSPVELYWNTLQSQPVSRLLSQISQTFHASRTSQRGMKFRSLGFRKVTSAKGSDCSICAVEAQGMQMTGRVICVETHHWFRCDSALLAWRQTPIQAEQLCNRHASCIKRFEKHLVAMLSEQWSQTHFTHELSLPFFFLHVWLAAAQFKLVPVLVTWLKIPHQVILNCRLVFSFLGYWWIW